MTALVSENTICCAFVGSRIVELVVGHLRRLRVSVPSVPWVSLPGPTGVLRCPGRMASEAERQPSLCLLECALVNVFVFVSRAHLFQQILFDMLFISFETSLHFSYLLPAVSQSILFTQMQICFTARGLIKLECCRRCSCSVCRFPSARKRDSWSSPSE